jgi:molybdopterin synthase sulfur carrier subunit
MSSHLRSANATVSIRYFALLRDLAGKAGEQVKIAQGETASRLFLRLAELYSFPLALADIRVAVNDEFTTSDHPLTDGDKLVFIPPVAGG